MFGMGKRKEEKKNACCCAVTNTSETVAEAEQKNATSSGIQVLGGGCAKCNELEDAVKAALVELHMDTAIDHVTDFAQIAAYGVMTTPALVIDGKVVSYGKVLKKAEAMKLLKELRG